MTYQRRDDGTPYAQTTTLTPQGQQIFDTQQGIAGTLADQAQARVNQLPTTGFQISDMYDPSSYNTSAIPMFGTVSTGVNGGVYGSTGNGSGVFGSYSGIGSNSAQMPGADGSTGSNGATVLPYDPNSYGDINQYDSQAGQAAFNEAYGYMKPAFDMDNERTMQNISDRGLPVGSQAYKSAMTELQNNHNQQIQSAANQAVAVAAQSGATKMQQEQGLRQEAYNEGLQTHQQQVSDIGNRMQTEQNLRQTDISNDLLQRQENMNEASAYLTGSPALQEPGAVQAPTYHQNTTDIAGITNSAYQNQMAAYNAQVAQNGSKWQGAANIAGSVAPLMFA